METIRVALIGKTGVGKSAFGNTLLGERIFKSTLSSESVTIKCETRTGMLPSGRQIKIVDTPGIMDTKGREVGKEIAKAIHALSPGPHAFLIVLRPGRATTEEKEVIKELKGLFGDETFLEHTIIIMTQKADINDENEDPLSIHSYIDTLAHHSVKELYEMCGKRIFAVENIHATKDEKKEYATDVINEIIKMGGYYSHAYFKMISEKKIKEEIEKVSKEQWSWYCSIL